MFLLAELKDTIRIPPDNFDIKLVDAVKDEINRKLANKVKIIEIPVSKPMLLSGVSFILGFVKCWSMHCT